MKDDLKKKRSALLASRAGSYSLSITCLVLAIIIVVNILVSILPAGITKYDISASKLYSVTSNTKSIVNALDKDVTVYWVVQADAEDEVIENLLDKYAELSDHISIIKKNPDIYPTFTAQYTSKTLANNSLIVESGDKNRVIEYSDIYLSDIDYSTNSYENSFDGEGAITSAISYVVSEDNPVIYLLEGHGETELPESLENQITKSNYEIKSLSLLTNAYVPEDADLVMIYAPKSDISELEAQTLINYSCSEGKLIVFSGTEEEKMPNLDSIPQYYGIEVFDGIIIDADSNHYAFQMPYVLIPEMPDNELTQPLTEAGYKVIMPISRGLDISDTRYGTAVSLLNTSELSYNKRAGYELTTYEQEEGDEAGPFSLAFSLTSAYQGKLIWFASSVFVEETFNSYSSGANLNLAMNAISSLAGETESISIRSKSLNYNYLTISAAQGAVIKSVMIFVLPVAVIACGAAVCLTRRAKKNEQN